MSLKISFESDVKGFERVQRALETQQKVLNENAESVERLSKAYAGVSKETNNIRGMESFKAAAGQVKDLTGALDTLIKNQSGLKGFIGLFSEFGREMGKVRMDAGTEVFKSMTTQLDTLRNSMKSTTNELGILKDKMSIAKKEGRLEDAQGYSQQIAEKTTSQIAEADIFGNLRNKVAWHKRYGASAEMRDVPGGAGWFQGGLGGGVSGAGLKTGVTGFIAGTVALNRLSTGVDQAIEMGHRGREAQFNRRMSIAQDTVSGNIGRQTMLDLGQGQEAEWMSGEATGRNLLRGVKLGTRQFLSWMSVPFGGKALGTNELKIEEANRLNELEKSQQFGLSEAGKLKQSIAGSDISMQAEMMGGMGYTDDYLRAATKGAGGARGTRTPIREALSSLGIAGQLGIMDVFKGATERRVNRDTPLLNRDLLESFSSSRTKEASEAETKIKQLDALIAKATKRQEESAFGGALRGDDDYFYDDGSKKINRGLSGNAMLSPSQAIRRFSSIRSSLKNKIDIIEGQKKDIKESVSGVDISEDYYSDLGNFQRDPKYFAVSEAARNEMFKQFQRRNAQNVMAGMLPAEAEQKATKDTFRTDLGVFRQQLGKDIGGDYYGAKAAQDYVTGLQGQTFNPVSATTIAAPAISAIDAARQDEQFNQFTPQEKFAMGANAQQNYQQEVNRPFGMVEQLTQVAFSKLGLGWGTHRTRLLDLMAKGRTDEAVSLISSFQKRTGKGSGERDAIYAALQEPLDIQKATAEEMYGGKNGEMEPDFAEQGYAPTGVAVLTGFDTSASGSRAGGKAFMGMKLSDGGTSTDVADPFKMSGQQLTTSDEAKQQGATMDVVKNLEAVLTERLGGAASQAIWDSISRGFDKISTDIRNAVKPTGDGIEPVTTTKSALGINGNEDPSKAN